MTDRRIFWWRTDLSGPERAEVQRAFDNRTINQGRVCAELERLLAEQLEVGHVVVTSSGTAALTLALLACGVGPGDEVIVPALTFVGTAHAALMLGAKVRLVDVRHDRPVLDEKLVEAAISKRTRVILPVHLNGTASDMGAIAAIATRRGLLVVEDAAQAFCSRNHVGYLGTQSNAGAFSMGLTKLITTGGEGGFVAIESPAIAERVRRLRNQGTLRIADNCFNQFGFNFRLTDIQASIGVAQMRSLPSRIESVRKNQAFFSERLAGLHCVKMMEPDEGDVPLWTQILCSDREAVIDQLASRGIETRPLHPCLADSAHLDADGDFPAACSYARHGLILPSGPDQAIEDLELTVAALLELKGRLPAWRDPVPS